MNEIKAVKCSMCGTLHELHDDNDKNYEFVTIHGNMCIGMGGDVIGNNIIMDEEKHPETIKEVNYSVICNSDDCWYKLQQKFIITNKMQAVGLVTKHFGDTVDGGQYQKLY